VKLKLKKRHLIIVLVLSAVIGLALGLSIISNIFEGLIPRVTIPTPIHIEASAPETVAVGAPFYINFTVANPNGFTVYARIHINFTLNGALSVDKDSMSYFWQETTFAFTGGSASCRITVSGNTWMFQAPETYPGWFIKIPSGTNAYRMQFQVNVQCESISYKVWLTS